MSPAASWTMLSGLILTGTAVVALINVIGAREARRKAAERELRLILNFYRAWPERRGEKLINFDSMSADEIRDHLEAHLN